MENRQKEISIKNPSSIAGIVLAVLAVGGIGWWGVNSLRNDNDRPIPSVSQPSNNQTTNPNRSTSLREERLQLFWLTSANNEIELISTTTTIEVEQDASTSTVLSLAIEKLLAGNEDPNYVSTIPKETQLLSVDLLDDGVHINLSEEFTFGGGSTSMVGRLAQVLYTATSLDPELPVWISVEGELLEILGGEGVVINEPITRQEFQENFEF